MMPHHHHHPARVYPVGAWMAVARLHNLRGINSWRASRWSSRLYRYRATLQLGCSSLAGHFLFQPQCWDFKQRRWKALVPASLLPWVHILWMRCQPRGFLRCSTSGRRGGQCQGSGPPKLVCVHALGSEREQEMIDRAGKPCREKCNRLGFASGVSVCNSTSLSQFRSGLCKGAFGCGCSFSHRGPHSLCASAVSFRGAGFLLPLRQLTS